MTYLFYIVAVLFPIFTAWVDGEHHNDKDYIEDHTSRIFQRSCFFLMCWSYSANLMFFSIFIFWVIFDSVRNLIVGENIFYVGETAITDRKFNSKVGLFISTKIIALLLAIFVLIKETL